MTTATIGLFYGSSTCYTEIAAEKIQQIMGPGLVTLHDLANDCVAEMDNYNYLILGIPTWDYGELQEDWENIWDDLDSINFTGKTVALYGLGDQVGYPEWFQDALGYLWAKVTSLGARTVGYWPTDDYKYAQSKATIEDGRSFAGLSLDAENQFELSEARLQNWCQQVLVEFDLDQP